MEGGYHSINIHEQLVTWSWIKKGKCILSYTYMQTNGVCQKISLFFVLFCFFVNNKPLKYREKIKELLPFTTRLPCVFLLMLIFNFCLFYLLLISPSTDMNDNSNCVTCRGTPLWMSSDFNIALMGGGGGAYINIKYSLLKSQAWLWKFVLLLLLWHRCGNALLKIVSKKKKVSKKEFSQLQYIIEEPFMVE